MDTEATLGGNEGADIQEPAAEVEQPHLVEDFTPIINVDIECKITLGPILRWCSEKILLISKLQKWKQEAISL